jgi:transaldolase
MKFFLDASNLQEAQEAIGLRLADGISLNVLDLANDKNYCNFISEIADMLDGPIIVPTFSEKEEDIVKEAGALKRISENVCIQLPISLENLKICRNLVDDGFFIEMSLCFSVQQAILASKMGASFVSVARSNSKDKMTRIRPRLFSCFHSNLHLLD